MGLYLDAAWESFLPVCAHLLLIQLCPHQPTAGSFCGAWEPQPRLRSVQKHLKGEWNTQTKMWQNVEHHSPEGKEHILWWMVRQGNVRNFIICAGRIFIHVSSSETHFGEDTRGWPDGTEDMKYTQGWCFQRPWSLLCSLSTSQNDSVYCCYSEQGLG